MHVELAFCDVDRFCEGFVRELITARQWSGVCLQHDRLVGSNSTVRSYSNGVVDGIVLCCTLRRLNTEAIVADCVHQGSSINANNYVGAKHQ